MERYAREYCRAHGIRYKITADGTLKTYSPITRSYADVININGRTENEVRLAIERHIAIFLH